MGIKHSKKKVLNTNLGFKIIVSLRMVIYVLNRNSFIYAFTIIIKFKSPEKNALLCPLKFTNSRVLPNSGKPKLSWAV